MTPRSNTRTNSMTTDTGRSCATCRFGQPQTEYWPQLVGERTSAWQVLWKPRPTIEYRPMQRVLCRRFPKAENVSPLHWCAEHAPTQSGEGA
jgi:hypothetical protein